MQVQITVKVDGKVVRPFVEQVAGTFDPDGFNPQSGWIRMDEIGLPSIRPLRAGAADAEPGDLDCGGSVNLTDVEPFITALLDPQEYENQYPDCDINNADGSIDLTDVEPLPRAVVALTLSVTAPHHPRAYEHPPVVLQRGRYRVVHRQGRRRCIPDDEPRVSGLGQSAGWISFTVSLLCSVDRSGRPGRLQRAERQAGAIEGGERPALVCSAAGEREEGAIDWDCV